MIKKIETLSDLQQYNSLSNEELNQILILHKKWLNHKKGGKRAILKGEIVFCINGSKCRTNKAKVIDGGGSSRYYSYFVYVKGKTYTIDNFDVRYNIECSTGIHFFRTRKEAETYECC